MAICVVFLRTNGVFMYVIVTALAIGFPNANNNVKDTGKVALYSYTGESWELFHVYNNNDSQLEGSQLGYVALTSDASKVAIGGEENSGFFEAFPNRNNQPAFDLSAGNEDFVLTENSTRITQIAATDQDGDEITYSFHGKDASFFKWNDGFLEFKQPPNYENPKSRSNSNTYSVTLKASDSKNYDYRFFEIDVQDDTNEVPPVDTIWGPSREYGLGSIDMELNTNGTRLVVLSDRNGSRYKGIDVYEKDSTGNGMSLIYTRTAIDASRITISGDGTHIAWTEIDTTRALEICDIRNLDNADCYSIHTSGEFDTDATDIDLNYDASAVIVGSSGFNNDRGTAVLWRRSEIERNAWDRNLGYRFDYVDVGFTGKRVQISSSGQRVAVVANRNNDVPQNPAVRIYELQNNGSYEARLL